MLWRKRRSHRETLARIERLELENAALSREIEVALIPLPPKKDPEWREGGVVELAKRLAPTGAIALRPGAVWPVEHAATVNYLALSAVSVMPGPPPTRRLVELPPGVSA
jgi:hypothetical protein